MTTGDSHNGSNSQHRLSDQVSANTADRTTVATYLLVNIAALVRVAAAFGGAWTMSLLVASALLWIGAFVLFVISYGPMVLFPPRANAFR